MENKKIIRYVFSNTCAYEEYSDSSDTCWSLNKSCAFKGHCEECPIYKQLRAKSIEIGAQKRTIRRYTNNH